MEEQEGEAGSFFGSESAQEQESQHVVEQGGAADSVNYGAQSPRVPRSQISRAHPGQTLGYAERTSAVLSALSGDDETALSAAEAAGEHTSHPQAGTGPAGAGLAAPAAGAAAASPIPGPPSKAQQQLQQQQQEAQPAGASKVDDPFSPPESTSPMYRANSVVSHTAAPLRLPLRRPVDTPFSLAPLQGAILGASPTTSRVERLPYAPPPAVGRPLSRPHSAQQVRSHLQPPLPGPSYASHSQATQPGSAVGGHSLPSTLGLAIGMAPPPPFPPAPQPVAAAAAAAPTLAAWVGLAASMGVPLDVLQAQGAAALGQQGQHAQTRLQQAEALQSMAAALQAQASVILQQQQQQQLMQGQSLGLQQSGAAAAPSAVQVHHHHQQEQEQQQERQQKQQPQEPPPQPQNAVIEASAAGGGVSMYSVPDLVGASVIEGHPLPPPFYPAGAAAGAAACTAPTLVSGVTLSTNPLGAPRPAAVAAAGSNQRPGSANRSSASPTARAGRDPRLVPSQAPASSMVQGQGQYLLPHTQPRPSQHVTTVAEPAGPADAAPASAGRQGSARGAEQEQHGMPSTDAAAIGGALGGDDMGANDGLEVQQAAPAPAVAAGSAEPGAGGCVGAGSGKVRQEGGEGGGGLSSPPGGLPPAPHGAASVMATLVSSGEQSDVESEISGMQAQAASGPHSHPAAGGEVQSPLPTMQPAAATTNAHMSLSLVAATASQPPWPPQQQQQHSASGQSPQGQGAAGSRLATLETGPDDDAAGGSVDMTAPAWRQQQHKHATSAPLFAVAGDSREAAAGPAPGAGGHPTASAPTVLPGQPMQPDQPQPAISVSLSAHGDGAEAPAELVPGAMLRRSDSILECSGHFAEHNPVAPQAQSSAFVFKQQQRHSAWEEHNTSAPPLAPSPGSVPVEEGQQEQDGEGSPRASTFDAPPAASEGTARGTILAGQAHSILTTAAAGDGDHADVGEGEALSPLVIGRVALQQLAPTGAGAGRHSGQGGLAGSGAVPHSAARSASIPASPQPRQAASPPARADGEAGAAVGLPPPEPLDLSTMAQDVGGPGEGGEQHTLSGQAPTAGAKQQRAAQACVQSSGDGACLQCAGLGGGAESVYANGDLPLGGGPHAEVTQPGAGAAAEVHSGELDGHGYASSIILGNGLLGGGLGSAVLAGAGSELTSPSSVSDKRSKRKRGNDD